MVVTFTLPRWALAGRRFSDDAAVVCYTRGTPRHATPSRLAGCPAVGCNNVSGPVSRDAAPRTNDLTSFWGVRSRWRTNCVRACEVVLCDFLAEPVWVVPCGEEGDRTELWWGIWRGYLVVETLRQKLPPLPPSPSHPSLPSHPPTRAPAIRIPAFCHLARLSWAHRGRGDLTFGASPSHGASPSSSNTSNLAARPIRQPSGRGWSKGQGLPGLA